MHDNKIHIDYDCTIHQTMTALLRMMHCVIRTKSYITTYKLLQCLSNYSGHYKYMHANVKINKYYCTL